MTTQQLTCVNLYSLHIDQYLQSVILETLVTQLAVSKTKKSDKDNDDGTAIKVSVFTLISDITNLHQHY